MAIHFCASEGHVECMYFLMKNGSSVNAKTDRGNTPLHLAALNGKIQVVQFLLESNTATLQKNNFGKTPNELARTKGHLQIAEIIEDHFGLELMGISNIREFIHTRPPLGAIIRGFLQRDIVFSFHNNFFSFLIFK